MENGMWVLAAVLAVYAFSAFAEVSWAIWVALISGLPVVLLMSSDVTPGL